MKLYALASLLALAALLAAALPAQATYPAATPLFTVSSSLAGKKVLRAPRSLGRGSQPPGGKDQRGRLPDRRPTALG